jgi:hypothetical protein
MLDLMSFLHENREKRKGLIPAESQNGLCERKLYDSYSIVTEVWVDRLESELHSA